MRGLGLAEPAQEEGASGWGKLALLSTSRPATRRDSTPHLRAFELFARLPVGVTRITPWGAVAPARRAAQRRRLEIEDCELVALSDQGLSLRAIGERVGMSAEGVRWRLRRIAREAGLSHEAVRQRLRR